MSQTGDRGFTLVEIVVVIVIIVAISGMAIPQIAASLVAATLRANARDLWLTAQYAHHHAVTFRTPSRLVLSAQDNRYWVEAEQSDERSDPIGFTPLTTSQGRARQLAQGIHFGQLLIQPRTDATSNSAVTFDPTGEADTAVIVITDDQRHWTLRIAPNTGRAELLEEQTTRPLNDRKDLDE